MRRYIYTAEADFESASAFDVLQLASLYQLETLRDVCVSELVRSLTSATCVQVRAPTSWSHSKSR